ncbi:MAG: hypothetical protein H7A03_11030 [Pseudomonadales bacterium]|nr:hypothetical protein [Pseudomonadales bacterium]
MVVGKHAIMYDLNVELVIGVDELSIRICVASAVAQHLKGNIDTCNQSMWAATVEPLRFNYALPNSGPLLAEVIEHQANVVKILVGIPAAP